MNDTIQLKAGNKETMPNLVDREPAYVRDEKALYIGTPEGNVKIGGDLGGLETKVEGLETKQTEQAGKLAEMETALGKKLEANQAAAISPIDVNAELSIVIETMNDLISALKLANIMLNQ